MTVRMTVMVTAMMTVMMTVTVTVTMTVMMTEGEEVDQRNSRDEKHVAGERVLLDAETEREWEGGGFHSALCSTLHCDSLSALLLLVFTAFTVRCRVSCEIP